MTDETLKYYDQNADAFVQGTISVIYRNVFSVHCMETAYWILAADQEGIQKKFEDLNLQKKISHRRKVTS